MDAKKIAAEKAVQYVNDKMTVGLGSGSTSAWAIQMIGEKVRAGLDIQAVASSSRSENLARQYNIAIVDFSQISCIDIYIDGADEVDKNYNLIKGGGGALLREKILAYNSKRFITIVDETKMMEVLGKFPLPVEMVPFASPLTLKRIQELGCTATIRQQDGKDFITDNGNLIADCRFNEIREPEKLNTAIQLIPGIVECGLFSSSKVSQVIVGFSNGEVREIEVTVH